MNETKKQYTLVDENDIPHQVFVDGFYGMLLSPLNSKVGFYQLIGIDASTKIEKRKITMTIVMPTLAMREFCTKFLAATEHLQTGTVSAPAAERP